jgi:hypothetical protein
MCSSCNEQGGRNGSTRSAFNMVCLYRLIPLTTEGRAWVAAAELPAAAHQVVMVSLNMIAALDALIAQVERELRAVAAHQKGCVEADCGCAGSGVGLTRPHHRPGARDRGAGVCSSGWPGRASSTCSNEPVQPSSPPRSTPPSRPPCTPRNDPSRPMPDTQQPDEVRPKPSVTCWLFRLGTFGSTLGHPSPPPGASGRWRRRRRRRDASGRGPPVGTHRRWRSWPTAPEAAVLFGRGRGVATSIATAANGSVSSSKVAAPPTKSPITAASGVQGTHGSWIAAAS